MNEAQEEVNRKNATALRAATEALRLDLDRERAEREGLQMTVSTLQQRIQVLEAMLAAVMNRASSGPTAR